MVGLLICLFYSLFASPRGRPAQTYHPILMGTCGLLGVIGLLAPVSVLWQWTRIDRDASGDVVVSSFLVWPRTTRLSPGTIESMPVVLTEERARVKRTYRRIGWRWRVLLKSTGDDAEFWVDQSRSKPEATSMPRRVKDFVLAFEAITGVQSMQPQASAWEGGRRWFSLGPARCTTSDVAEERHAFRSLDEVPSDLRPKLEAMMQEAMR